MTENAIRPDTDANAEDLRRLIHGYQFTQALYAAERLDIPDLLAEGTQTVEELAMASHAHAPSLARLLRGLASLGVVAEGDDGTFSLTEMGMPLRSDAPDSQRAWLLFSGADQYAGWGDLLHSVRTGETTAQKRYGMSSWEWRAQHPDLNTLFNDAMVELSTRRATAMLNAYDFSRFKQVVDVGGGRGALLGAILSAYPNLRGVLFDLPHVVDGAAAVFAEAGIGDCATIAAGDFFTTVPEGGDLYILSVVLHDWNDQQAATILANCRRVMGAGSTLLLIERVLPVSTAHHWEPYFSDLNMMQALGGRERTELEWRRLLEAAGFALQRVVPTEAPTSLVEAVPAPDAR